MRKRWKGYFSIEASLIMPVVLFLYLLIILAALFLYCRCAISQDTFLLGMRAGCFTYGGESYGEVVYGQEEGWAAETYVEERLYGRRQRYPLYAYLEGHCMIGGEEARIETLYRWDQRPYITSTQRYNPVRMIREGRK